MMIIDVRKLNAQKKYAGDMQLEYNAPETLMDIPYVKFATPVKIQFSYELFEDDSLEIRGEIFYTLEGQCSRCLKEAKMDIEGELDAYFQPKKDCEDYAYSNGIIDLTQAINEAIMASLPFVFSCGENCEGLSYTDTIEEQ